MGDPANGAPVLCRGCGVALVEPHDPNCGDTSIPGILLIDWLWARKWFGPHWQERLYGLQVTEPGF
jgi:hypothetical protein